MYTTQKIEECCKQCGINSIATELLIKTITGDTIDVKSLLLPEIKGQVNITGVDFYRIEKSAYYISKCGMVYSSKRKRVLVCQKRGNYKCFQLSDGVYKKNEGSRRRFIHRIIAEYFVPNPECKPYVNHIDNNPLNNHYTNLEWVTNKENRIHYVSKFQPSWNGSKRFISDKDKENIIQLRSLGVSYKEICKIYTTDIDRIMLWFSELKNKFSVME